MCVGGHFREEKPMENTHTKNESQTPVIRNHVWMASYAIYYTNGKLGQVLD